MNRTRQFLQILLSIMLIVLLTASQAAADETHLPIQNGDNGESVVRVQERLFDLGYYFYKPTGSFRTVTRNAVMLFQQNTGLLSDGTIGAESFQALFAHNSSRNAFRSVVPLGYTAQGAWLRRGTAQRWEVVKTLLLSDTEYTIINAQTGESCSLVYLGGENHAEFRVPTRYNRPDAAVLSALSSWLGASESYYKCGVLLLLEDQRIAASIQWNGADRICLYTTGSTSHVFGLEDVEHNAVIARVADTTGE